MTFIIYSVKMIESTIFRSYRGIAQLVEHWSPKPGVVGSSPATPAKFNESVVR